MFASEIIPASATTTTSESPWTVMNERMVGSFVRVSASLPSNVWTSQGEPGRIRPRSAALTSVITSARERSDRRGVRLRMVCLMVRDDLSEIIVAPCHLPPPRIFLHFRVKRRTSIPRPGRDPGLGRR
jgi:hypothetical protein